MKPERWQQIDPLLEAALERPPAERAAFLAEDCAGDETLRQEVESLLRSDEMVNSFIETPVVTLTAEVLAQQEARSLTGQQFGHYQILSPLGKGGMGEVYLADDTKLHRRVALKLLPAKFAADQDAGRRFLREARAAAALEHPNICAIYEIGEDNGQRFIVMQYVEGETLADRLKREQLSLNECLALATQIAEALAEAHAHQIIHRAIKPANNIITPRGQVKVLDFGLAKFITETSGADQEASAASQLSTPGLVMGTVPYMSPEQVRSEELDARTDIFSLGVVLYEMLSGQQPFEAKSTAELISAILTQQPSPLRVANNAVSTELERIVRKCLENEPAQRYQTMKALASDLGQVSGASVPVEPAPQATDTLEMQAASTQPRVAGQNSLRARTAGVGLAVGILVLMGTVYALYFRHATPTANNNAINSVAYDLFVRGKVVVGSENRDDNETAINLLEQAVKADPNFAPAWAGLARAYNKKAFISRPARRKSG